MRRPPVGIILLLLAATSEAYGFAYVVAGAGGSRKIKVIDTTQDVIVGEIPIADGYGVSVDSEGLLVYITDPSSNKLRVLDQETQQFIAVVDLPGANPRGVFENLNVAPTNQIVYVAEHDLGSMARVSYGTWTVTGHNEVCVPAPCVSNCKPFSITLNPNTQTTLGYVSSTDCNVHAFDWFFGSSIYAEFPNTKNGRGIAVHPGGGTLYVVTSVSGSADRLKTLDPLLAPQGPTVVDNEPLRAEALGIAINPNYPDIRRLYVTTTNAAGHYYVRVYGIDTPQNPTFISEVPVWLQGGTNAGAIQVHPIDGVKIYAIVRGADRVAVIDPEKAETDPNNAVVKFITVGQTPRAFGNFIDHSPGCP